MDNSKYSMPMPGERCAYPQPRVAKRAALLFDRIYVEPYSKQNNSIPSSIKFDVPRADDLMNTHGEKIIEQLLFGSPELKKPLSMITKDDKYYIGSELIMKIRVECYRLAGHNVTPVYERQERYLLDYPFGNTLVYQAALENLPEIIEDDVSWEQILQFRSDKDAIRKYRELRFWLEYSLSAQSIEHARDIIASKIENYEWAIRKHGLKTTTGALSSIFSWEGLVSLGAGAGIGAALGGTLWSALTGALFAVGRASVWVAERMIEMQDIKHSPDAVVALICDAKRLVKSDSK